MYPKSVSFVDLLRFRRLLGQKGQDKLEWDIWKYSYRKAEFTAISNAFNFLGLVDSTYTLTSIGKRFVFGADDKALTIGLIQSEYFELFRRVLYGPETEEQIFSMLSICCNTTVPERERRLMFRSFIDLSTRTGILETAKGQISLTPVGQAEIEKHSKIPLWIHDFPIFEESKRIERFKALYYETGHPFRELVKDAFSELGFEAKNLPKKPSGIPDIEISFSDFKGIIETKGENKQIGENDINQISKSQSKPEFKGKRMIFVGNAFRLKCPNARAPCFHANAIALAESINVVLVSSMTLLNALQIRWKQKNPSPQKIIQNLAQNGLCTELI